MNSAQGHAIKQRWLDLAFHNAGIDPARWHPGAGVASNRDTIERVYGYYAQLYRRNSFFEWAGLATLIGPAFYAGFRDLGALPDAARRLIGVLFGRASRRVARWATGELGFYETTFLIMQKKIFEDQAVMHEAYLGGGVDAIRQLRDAAVIDDATLEAWARIDRGKNGADPAALSDGNRALLFREQHDIIDRFYMRMFDDTPLGRPFTYVLTLAGAPSLPDAKAYAEVFPLSLRVPVTDSETLNVATPFAAGNIALFADRWALIEADTLPDYLRLIHQRAAEAAALIGTPIAQRVGQFRLLSRFGTLISSFLTHWRLRLDGARETLPAPVSRALAAPVVIDLRAPPASAAAELPEGRDSRTWENPSRAPFQLIVQLPGDRQYRARSTRATMLASQHGQAADRLIVTLETLDLDGAGAALKRHAADWNIPAEAVQEWAPRARLRASGADGYRDRAYSTQVFTAAPLGPVTFQLQIAQHLREGAFVLTALFRWEV